MIFSHNFWRPFLDCMPQLFFRLQYVWFSEHLWGLAIPNSSGQVAELIVLYHSTRADLYSNKILLKKTKILWKVNLVWYTCIYIQENLYLHWGPWVNSVAPGRYGCNFKSTIFKLIVQNSSLATDYIQLLLGECHSNSQMISQLWFR